MLETFDYNCPYKCGADKMSLKAFMDHALSFSCRQFGTIELAVIYSLQEIINKLQKENREINKLNQEYVRCLEE